MHILTRRLPSRDTLSRTAPKWGGFLAGAVGTVLFVLLAQAILTGQGLGEPPRHAEVIYPNL